MNWYKKIIALFLFSLSVVDGYADTLSNDTYIIEAEQLYSVNIVTNKYSNNHLSVSVKPEYWEPLFEYALAHMDKQGRFNVGGVIVEPYIRDLVYHDIHFMFGDDNETHKAFTRLREQVKGVKTEVENKQKLAFLEKMYKKHTKNSMLIVSQLINDYHSENTLEASHRCVEIYDAVENNQTKLEILQKVHNKIYDCYTDLNQTAQARSLLDIMDSSIAIQDRYLQLEKRAYLYVIENNPQQARLYYQKALESLKQTDFFQDTLYLTLQEKQDINASINQEIKRFEEILRDL